MKKSQVLIILVLAALLLPACGGAPGFKDPSLCPNSDVGVSVPERLPNVRWSAVGSPSDGRIWAVEVLSATDAWAVDLQGNILHYDGAAWTAMSSPTSYALRGLSMLSTDEGWAVGHDNSSPYSSVIIHYANQSWSIVAEPEVPGLWDVDFVAPDKGWAVGPGILYYDGNDWITFSSPEELSIPVSKGVSEKFGSLYGVDMVSVDEGWAVGEGGTILHYQGDIWQRIDSPVETRLYDVDMHSMEDGWIVGSKGTILHFDGAAWSITAAPTEATLWGVSVDDEGEAWAVGGDGTLLRFDGQTWGKMEIPATGYIQDVDTSHDGAAWVVGDDGLILRSELLDTDVPPPNLPLLKTIDNSDGDGSFSVSWESVPGNVNYVLQEADEAMCPTTIYLGSETSKEVSRKDIGTYYYRVSALGVSGQSEWSEIKSVEVTVPPPPCALECTGSWVGMGPSLDIEITCESGEVTQSMSSWQTVEEGRGLVTHFEGTHTYKNTGNEYKIVADASLYQSKDSSLKVNYHVEVT
jgi:photosystem II stability/assembly factor-like uncharacterized protein